MVAFNSGPFDPSLCATACSAYGQSGSASLSPCKFFNTYMIYKNGQPIAQNCVMYSQSWTSAVATNNGYNKNGNSYTFGSSWIYSNATNPGSCTVSSGSSVGSSTTSSSSSGSSYSNPISSTISSSSSSSSGSSSSSSSPTVTAPSSSLSSMVTSSSQSSSRSRSFTTSISSNSQSYSSVSPTPDTSTGTIISAATMNPSPVLPTTTDINGIKPAASHAVDSRYDNSDGTYHFVNINATAPDGMVSIEKFIPFIQNTDCSSSSIKLTFTTVDALKMAQQSWPKPQFPLSTIDGYCGDGQGSRTYYKYVVSKDAAAKFVLTHPTLQCHCRHIRQH